MLCRPTLLLVSMLISMLALIGCGPRIQVSPIDAPDGASNALDVETPRSAAEQAVQTKKDAAAIARASGNVLATLAAERALAAARVQLAKEQVIQWEQAAKAKDNEIRDEKDRSRQEFLYWFSGVCGLLALLATAGALFWPTTRVITRPIAVILAGLVPLALLAAWIIPFLLPISLGVGVLILAAGCWYMVKNEKQHRLKDKAASQVAAAVEEAKEVIPSFAAGYKEIFRGHIDEDADVLLTKHRKDLSDKRVSDAAERLAKARAL